MLSPLSSSISQGDHALQAVLATERAIITNSNTSSSSRKSSFRVTSFSASQIESNMPMGEDRYNIISDPVFGIFACTVIDGHGGSFTANITLTRLLDSIVDGIKSMSSDRNGVDDIVKHIENCFSETDTFILNEALKLQRAKHTMSKLPVPDLVPSSGNDIEKENGSQQLQQQKIIQHYMNQDFGRAGACALACVVYQDILYVAHVGDCRAVLCRQTDNDETASAQSSTNKRSHKTMKEVIPSEHSLASLSTSFKDIAHNPELVDDETFMTTDSILEERHINFSSNIILSSEIRSADDPIIARKRQRLDIGGDTFVYCSPNSAVVSITRDHCCAVEAECLLVSSLTSDANPLRPSESDKRNQVRQAPRRVGGSLAVTRAIGDGYLKVPELSPDVYRPNVPYITSRPTVTYKRLNKSDKMLVLASDGLWNYISPREIAICLEGRDGRDSSGDDSVAIEKRSPLISLQSHSSRTKAPSVANTFLEASRYWSLGFTADTAEYDKLLVGEKTNNSSLAQALVDRCVANAAVENGLSNTYLKYLPKGQRRREIIDDVTTLVLKIDCD